MHQDRFHLQAGVADLQQPMLMLACLVVSDVGQYVGHLFCGLSRHVYSFLNGCVTDGHTVYVVYNLDNHTTGLTSGHMHSPRTRECRGSVLLWRPRHPGHFLQDSSARASSSAEVLVLRVGNAKCSGSIEVSKCNFNMMIPSHPFLAMAQGHFSQLLALPLSKVSCW